MGDGPRLLRLRRHARFEQRRHPLRFFRQKSSLRTSQAAWRYGKVLAGVPLWLGLDAVSRRLFNEVFFRQYRGLRQDWLVAQSEACSDHEIRPEDFRRARKHCWQRDRAQGYRLVLVSGGFDFDLAPFVREFGFDDLISNRLEFADGIATGRVIAPLLAEQEKVRAIQRLLRRV